MVFQRGGDPKKVLGLGKRELIIEKYITDDFFNNTLDPSDFLLFCFCTIRNYFDDAEFLLKEIPKEKINDESMSNLLYLVAYNDDKEQGVKGIYFLVKHQLVSKDMLSWILNTMLSWRYGIKPDYPIIKTLIENGAVASEESKKGRRSKELRNLLS